MPSTLHVLYYQGVLSLVIDHAVTLGKFLKERIGSSTANNIRQKDSKKVRKELGNYLIFMVVAFFGSQSK
jgi:hypothetical protein